MSVNKCIVGFLWCSVGVACDCVVCVFWLVNMINAAVNTVTDHKIKVILKNQYKSSTNSVIPYICLLHGVKIYIPFVIVQELHNRLSDGLWHPADRRQRCENTPSPLSASTPIQTNTQILSKNKWLLMARKCVFELRHKDFDLQSLLTFKPLKTYSTETQWKVWKMSLQSIFNQFCVKKKWFCLCTCQCLWVKSSPAHTRRYSTALAKPKTLSPGS